MAAFIMVAGLYASIVGIIDSMCLNFYAKFCPSHQLTFSGYKTGGLPGPFSCVNRAL